MKKTGGAKKSVQKKLDHSHTGKLRHHRHTSYGSLAIILLLTLVPLFSASRAVASAATMTDPTLPVTGSYGTYAVVEGQAPKVAPTITSPVSGASFSTSDLVRVQGSCQNNTLVKLFKNEVLAGSALCQAGSYQISINLFIGANSLVARAYNNNDAVSPDSKIVSVQFSPPGTNLNGTSQLSAQGSAAGQFYITSAITHHGYRPGETITWPLTIVGGQAPYAISVSWGDGKTDLYSRSAASELSISHVYAKAAGSKGSYPVTIKATDQAGTSSFLQLTAIVNGDAQAVGLLSSAKGGYDRSTVIRFAWQLLALAAIIVLSFWLGERRELGLLKRTTVRAA